MASAALFDLLPDFAVRTARPGRETVPVQPAAAPEPAIPAFDPSAMVAEAVARAESELTERLTLAHRAALDEERRAASEEARLFVESLGEDIGLTIGSRLEAVETRVAELVSQSVTRIVGSLLSEDLQKRSVAELAATVRQALRDGEAVRIDVRGPTALYASLEKALGPHADSLHFIEAPGFDLTVAIDETLFETRMSEWSAILSEVLS